VNHGPARFHREVGLALALAFLAVLPFLPQILGYRAVFLLDVLHQHYSWQAMLDRVLAAAPGQIPWWDPYAFCGSPLLADPQRQVLYPPALLHRILPFPNAYGLYVAFHVALTVTGMAAFLRAWGIGAAGTALGALAFGLGAHPFLLAHNPQSLASVAWLPWVAHFAASGRPGAWAGVAVTVGWLALAGLPPYLVCAAVLAGIVAAARERPSSLRRGAQMIAGWVLGLAAAAALLGPAIGYVVVETTRGQSLPAGMQMLDDFPIRNLLGYISPYLICGDGRGRLGCVRPFWMTLHSVGLVCLGFAVAGLVERRDRSVRTCVILIVTGLALGLGSRLPVAGPWLKAVPPLSYFRHSAMWLVLADFGVAWLGAMGLESVLGKIAAFPRWRRLSRIAAGAVVTIACAELVWTGIGLQPTVPADWVMTPSAEERFLAGRIAGPANWGRVVRWPPSVWPGARDDEAIWGRDRKELAGRLRASLQPNLPAAAGARQMDGENPLVPNDMRGVLERIRTAGGWLPPSIEAVLRRHGVRYVLTHELLAGRQPAFEGGLRIYELKDPRPAAWIEPPGAGHATVVDAMPGLWRVRVVTGQSATLLVNEAAVRGWKIMEGPPSAVLQKGEPGLLTVALPAGRYGLILRYEAPWWGIAWALSLCALGVLAAWAWRGVT